MLSYSVQPTPLRWIVMGVPTGPEAGVMLNDTRLDHKVSERDGLFAARSRVRVFRKIFGMTTRKFDPAIGFQPFTSARRLPCDSQSIAADAGCPAKFCQTSLQRSRTAETLTAQALRAFPRDPASG